MKVTVMIIAETCKDGVGKHVADLVRNLNKEKYEIVLVHGIRRVDYYFEIMMKMMQGKIISEEVKTFNRNIHPLDDLKALIRINGLMRKYRPEIVHCHSSKAGVIGRMTAKGKSYVKKMYYTPHAYAVQNKELVQIKYRLYLWVEKKMAASQKAYTINVSQGEQQFALRAKIMEDHQSSVIYNAIEDIPRIPENSRGLIRTELKLSGKQTMVVCVARLYDQKYPDLFLRIAKEVAEERPTIAFVWVGEGPLLEAMVAKVNEESLHNVHFIGHRKDVHYILDAADIYLSTARYEGMPYTLIEACRSGLPMVASDIIGNNEVVEANKNGYLYPLTQNCRKAVDKIVELCDNESLRERLGKAARETYEMRFTINQMVSATEELYDGETLYENKTL